MLTFSDRFSNVMVKILAGIFPSRKLRRKIQDNFYIREEDPYSSTLYERNNKQYNIGKHTHVHENTRILNPKETIIGSYCSIADNCDIGVFMHPQKTLSCHPFVYCDSEDFLQENMGISVSQNRIDWKGDKGITIGNDVWIGTNTVIMNGITIGDGAIIGSSAVVTKDVPPYAIVVGIPAKILKYRFDKDIIDKLLEIKWWDYPEDFIQKLQFDDISKGIELLEKNSFLKTNK